MILPAESQLLRVYALASDRAGGTSLHEAIVRAARQAGLAGATVLAGTMGFAQGGRFFSSTLVDVGFDRQPMVVELVDGPERLAAFLPVLHGLVRGRRLVTLERALVVRYAPGGQAEALSH